MPWSVHVTTLVFIFHIYVIYAAIILGKLDPEDEGTMILINIGNYLPVHFHKLSTC